MATFNGTELGPVVEIALQSKTALQVTSYPGVNGLGVQRLGSRGGQGHAHGLIYADNGSDLAALENDFHGYVANATSADLVDTEGTTWPNVIMTAFTPIGNISYAPGFGWNREYEMTFLLP